MNDCVENEEYELLHKLILRVTRLEEELKRLSESKKLNESRFSESINENIYLAFLDAHFN